MSLTDAFVFEPFSVNQPLIDSLLLEPDSFEVYVAIGSGGGSGTISDPYLVNTAALFDPLMNSFPPYTTVHLGPGLFPTQGHADGVSGGWQPKRGQRIVGSGIDVTTVKLAPASPTADKAYFAIGADDLALIDGFEASDFTVDCNLGALAGVAAGAIKVYGTHILIQRVRAINFGTRSATQKGMVIATAGADPALPEPFDCVVEECVIEQPYDSNVRETTCVSLNARENSNGVLAYHRACVIRNCTINCEYVSKPLAISSITYSGTTATVDTTPFQHGLSGTPWVIVSGALENSVISTKYNGSFQVTNVLSATQFQYTMPGTPSALPTGQMLIGKAPSHRVAIQSLSLTGTGPYTATLTTLTPHNRVMGNNVLVNGVTPSQYNGSFAITAIPSPTQLQYTMATNPGTPTLTNAYIGADFRGIEADGGIGTVIESNQIYNCFCGCYHDAYSTKDVVLRENYFRGVNFAVYQNVGGISGGDSSNNPTRLGSSLTHTGATATFTTAQAHGLVVGQAVAVGGATPLTYNGTFAVASVPTPTSFTYIMSSVPGADASGSFAFGALWQVGRIIVEDNVIELILNIISSGFEGPVGVKLYDRFGSHGTQFIFQQAIIRGNVIRHVDNASDSSLLPLAIYLDSCLGAIVEDNDINLDSSSPIRHYTMGSAKYFNNQSPGGKPIQGYYYPETRYWNELTTEAELSAILAT